MVHQDLLDALELAGAAQQRPNEDENDGSINDDFSSERLSSTFSRSSSTESISLDDPTPMAEIPLSPTSHTHTMSPSATTTTTAFTMDDGASFDPTLSTSTPRTSSDVHSVSLDDKVLMAAAGTAVLGAGVGIGAAALASSSRGPSEKPPIQPTVPSNDPGSSVPPMLNRVGSISSTITTSSMGKKESPDSIIVNVSEGSLILGIALVDFNHSVGPRIELAYPESLLEEEEVCKILPFLALPDGAHQSSEDYSYFHLTLANGANPESTVFGISCNRQIAAADLLEKHEDVSRSTVQKAVVVLASKPVFGPVRDKLGVVTRALFNQRDFRDTHILIDYYSNLELSLKSQLTESGMYMGTSLRELIHTFRHRTLVLLKLLMLQKRIMFYGHPVERLCTYQYSLISLIPNLLLALEDAASPSLDRREANTTKATELRTSDRNSLMKYLGLPLNIFGRDAFFQPYLPLQQVELLKSNSWLCGTTNTIATQQRDCQPDLLIDIELNTFEFKNPNVERLVSLTPADRKWMDDIVRDVNDGWNEKDPSRPLTMQFKGSDDYLRAKFEDYVCSSLATVKYDDFLRKAGKAEVGLVGATGDDNVVAGFGELWIAAFRTTNAYDLWDKVTDPAIFDICEPRHPCESRPTPISDIGLRLAEGLHELKVTETVAPAREAISQGISAASSGLFRAFEGVRSEVAARMARSASTGPGAAVTPSTDTAPPRALTIPTAHTPPLASSSPLAPIGSIPSKSPAPAPAPPLPQNTTSTRPEYPPPPQSETATTATTNARGLRPLSLAPSAVPGSGSTGTNAVPAVDLQASAQAARATISSWGSFLAKKAADFKRTNAAPPTTAPTANPPVTGSSANGTPFV